MSGPYQLSLRKRITHCLRIIFKKNNAEEKQTLRAHPQQQCLQENETPASCKLPHHDEDVSTSECQHPRSVEFHENTTSTSSTDALTETKNASTQTTPTPLFEQLARRMSNMSLQEQQAEQPSPQTQGTTTTNTTPTFCQPCQKARAKPNYGPRVAALLDPLDCSKCYVDHPAIFFSESQRKAPDSTTPDRLTRLKSFSLGDPCHRPAQQRMSCHICRTGIVCDPLAKDSDPQPANPFSNEHCSIERTCWWSLEKGGATQEAWTSKLNPESYGHFVDQDTKHITWCDDRRCTTTFELLRYAGLLNLGTNQLERMKEALEQDSARGVDILDHRTNWEIERSLRV
ncbi:hypothetical protein EDB80DRAFT_677910 [Ilyonectria destructans]|nr:hypothetical protein EDB80DRAFT_677910 [Ilyonectria destructans]